MKTKNLVHIALIVMAVVLTSCGGKKAPASKFVDIDSPCSGPEYMSNNEYFRAYGFGESPDREIAMKLAQTNASQKMAAQISTKVKSVTENYANQYTTKSGMDVKKRFNDITRMIVDQTLNGAVPVCNKLRQNTETGNYEYHVCLELSGNKILEKMKEAAMKDEQLRTDFEYERFKETFNEEMNNMNK